MMSTSRRRMREASRSLAIAFNIGQAQEALYRADAGEPLDDEARQLFRELNHFFQDASRGLLWTQAAVEDLDATDGDNAVSDAAALRSLSLVLPVVRSNAPAAPKEILAQLTDISDKLGSGQLVSKHDRTTFDQILGDLARHASAKLDASREERANSISLLPLPE